MKSNAIRVGLLIGASIGAAVPLQGLADDVPANAASEKATTTEEQLEDIVVTARRTDERLQDVPASISVFNEQQLENRNIVQGADLAAYTPSLTVYSRYGAELSTFALRGFLQEANTAPSVGVYFADVTMPRSLGFTDSGSNVPIGSFMDLENTQVIKGPQGTLFGRNTTGGAILMVPKKPTNNLDGYIEASAGDFGMWRTQAVLNAPINDGLAVRFGVDHMSRDGYITNFAPTGVHDFDNTDYTYARVSILATLTPDIENYTVAHYSTSSNHGFASKIVECNPTPPAGLPQLLAPLGCAQIAQQNSAGLGPFTTDVPDQDPYMKTREWQAINTTTWNATDNLTFKNIASYGSIVRDLQYRLTGENFSLGGFFPFSTTDIGHAPDGNHATDQWTVTEEFRLQGRSFGGRLTWQSGLYYERSESPGWNEAYTNVFLSCPDKNIQNLTCSDPLGFGDIFDAKHKTTFDDKAVYGQATYSIISQLSLTAGVRYTKDDTRSPSESTDIVFPLPATPVRICNDQLRLGLNPVSSAAQCLETFDASSHAVTGTADIDYKPTDDYLLYAKWSRGYRPGGLNADDVGVEAWAPEHLTTYEVGAKSAIHGPINGYVDVAAFYNNFTNQQLDATTFQNGIPRGPAIVNAGSSYIEGLELDSNLNLTRRLNLEVGYSFLNTKITKLTAPASGYYTFQLLAREGDPLPEVPKNRISATLAYKLPISDRAGDVSVGATFVHTDRQFFNRNSGPDYQYLPSSNLLNANVNWNNVFKFPVDLSFFMTNVTNEVVETVTGGEYVPYGWVSVQYAPPRMWGLRARYRFGR